MDRKTERKNMLKKAGYFTVETLLQKLQELKEIGLGDKLVIGTVEHFRFCEYSEVEDNVLIC